MKFAQWKSLVYKLRALFGFFGIYIIFSVILTTISFVALIVIFIDPNDPDLGRAAAGLIPFILSPIIGMTLALIIMYFFEQGFQDKLS